MHDVLTTHAVVDDVLESFRDALGPDAIRYRNHVYRGLNYQRKLLRLNAVPDDIALAWALPAMDSRGAAVIRAANRWPC